MEYKRIVKTIKWCKIKEVLEKIYRNNQLLSPYQSYDFLNTVRLGRLDTNPFAGVGFHAINWVLYHGEDPICVVPCYIKKHKKSIKIVLAGTLTSAGHLDFVYSPEYSYEDHLFLMNEIKSTYGNSCRFIFDRISQHSLIYQYEAMRSAEQASLCEMIPSKMVTIQLPNTHEEWYLNLSKSVRQNIRTAYNRLNTDGKTFVYSYHTAVNKPTKQENKDMMKLFCRRLCEHSKKNRLVLEQILYFLKKRNPMTLGIDSDPGYVSATVYIQDESKNELAAFFTGIVSNSGKILVPRLSINIDYARYSPGALLINETMKHILDESTERYTEFDLQRGDEPYKYSYGGKEYFNYEWMN